MVTLSFRIGKVHHIILRSERSEASKERRFCKGPASGRGCRAKRRRVRVSELSRVRVGPD